jgi:hypothetical protein
MALGLVTKETGPLGNLRRAHGPPWSGTKPVGSGGWAAVPAFVIPSVQTKEQKC